MSGTQDESGDTLKHPLDRHVADGALVVSVGLPPDFDLYSILGKSVRLDQLERTASGWVRNSQPLPVFRLDEALASIPRGSADAVIVGGQFFPERASLGTVAALLREKGTICAVFPTALGREPFTRIVRQMIVSLSELGFVVVSPEPVRDVARSIFSGALPPLLVARHDRFVIRSYEDGDEQQILDLFGKSFGQSRSVEHWNWEYRDDPFGNHRISLAFDPDRRLVAQYTGYAVPIWADVPGYPTLAYQIGDTMTALDVRNIGRAHTSILGRTVRHFYAAHCEQTVAFNYGFNVSNIQKLSTRYFGSFVLDPVPYRVRGMNPPDESDRRGRIRRFIDGPLQIERVASAPGEEWSEFFRRVAPHYRFLVRRDATYVGWRYFRHPSTKYLVLAVRHRGRMVGWSVFLRKGESLVWGDALFEPGHAGAAGMLLGEALRSDFAAGAEQVDCWFPPQPLFWDATLRQLGFEHQEEPFGLSILCVPFLDAESPERMRTTLYYTACDSDLF